MSAIEAKRERSTASARELNATFAKEIAPDASVEGIRFVFNQLAGLLNRKLPSVGAFHEAVRIPADGRTIPVDVIVPARVRFRWSSTFMAARGWPVTPRAIAS